MFSIVLSFSLFYFFPVVDGLLYFFALDIAERRTVYRFYLKNPYEPFPPDFFAVSTLMDVADPFSSFSVVFVALSSPPFLLLAPFSSSD